MPSHRDSGSAEWGCARPPVLQFHQLHGLKWLQFQSLYVSLSLELIHYVSHCHRLTLSVTKCCKFTHFQKRQENSHICELWPGKRAAWRHYLIKTTHATQKWSVGTWMCRLELWCSFHLYTLSILKKTTRSGLRETCHKCLSRMKGRHRGCALVSKTAERKTATARVRGMKGVCRFGRMHMRWGELLPNSWLKEIYTLLHTSEVYIHT